jgi:hypothetical protein
VPLREQSLEWQLGKVRRARPDDFRVAVGMVRIEVGSFLRSAVTQADAVRTFEKEFDAVPFERGA